MMKLTVNNIEFVKELTHNGTTYSWFVGMKSKAVSDGRNYAYADEKGRTLNTVEFPKNELPKTVQKFMENKVRKVWNESANSDFVTYVYM